MLVLRTIAGTSAMRGRSACDGCAAPLAAAELIPILSFIRQRGRCRSCGARIDPLHPVAELGGALIGAAAGWLSPDADGLALALFGWLLIALALIDARALWLPDRWTATLALAGVALGTLATGVPLVDRLIGGAAGYASLALIAVSYRTLRGRDGMGGGDPKLFGAIGLWLGWIALPQLLLIAALMGLAVATLRIIGASGHWRTMELPLGTLLALAAGLIGFVMAGAAA